LGRQPIGSCVLPFSSFRHCQSLVGPIEHPVIWAGNGAQVFVRFACGKLVTTAPRSLMTCTNKEGVNCKLVTRRNYRVPLSMALSECNFVCCHQPPSASLGHGRAGNPSPMSPYSIHSYANRDDLSVSIISTDETNRFVRVQYQTHHARLRA
jgi:hypothetical protein